MFELSKRLLGMEGSTVELTLRRNADAHVYGTCICRHVMKDVAKSGTENGLILMHLAAVSVVRKNMSRQSATGLSDRNRHDSERVLRDKNSVVIL